MTKLTPSQSATTTTPEGISPPQGPPGLAHHPAREHLHHPKPSDRLAVGCGAIHRLLHPARLPRLGTRPLRLRQRVGHARRLDSTQVEPGHRRRYHHRSSGRQDADDCANRHVGDARITSWSVSLLYPSYPRIGFADASVRLKVWLAVIILGRDVGLGISAVYYRWISLPPPKTFSRYWDFSLPSAEVRPTTISKYNTALQLGLMGLTTLAPVVPLDLTTSLAVMQ